MKSEQPEKKTILIVDDVIENIDIFIGILSDTYRIRVATTGKEAISQVKQEKPDLILLDFMLPDMSGYEVCRELKNSDDTEEVPIILTSSFANIRNEELGLQIGISDFLYEPFSPELVRVRVHSHLEKYMKHLELEEEVSRRTRKIQQVQDAMIASFAFMTEARDQDTGDHIFRTQLYFELIAQEVFSLKPDLFSFSAIKPMALSSSLHDIGKIGIPDSILLKRGPLTPQEFDIMKEHPTIGGDILKKTCNYLGTRSNDFLVYAREISSCHHEKWDGSGYPKGLKGEEIPISARIMAIIDVYDALRSERPYKQPFSHERSMSIIFDGDGRVMPSHFDPLILRAFRNLAPLLEKISSQEHPSLSVEELTEFSVNF